MSRRPALCISLVLITLLHLTTVCLAQGKQQCYFTDGTPADDDFPCVDNASGASPCCGSGGVCLTNGLCFDGRGINRGSCTDQSWQSSQCAQYCLQYLYSGLWECSNDGYYSCEFGNCSSTFSVPAGRLQLNTAIVSSLGLDAPTATVTSAANTVTATTTETRRASGSVVAPVSQGGVSTGAAAGIGAGVGIPLLIAAVAFGVLFMLERKKRRKLERGVQLQPHEQQQHSLGYDAYYKGGHDYRVLPHGHASEMDTLHHTQELDGQRRVPELQGDEEPK